MRAEWSRFDAGLSASQMQERPGGAPGRISGKSTTRQLGVIAE
jgi:hypothetical protein